MTIIINDYFLTNFEPTDLKNNYLCRCVVLRKTAYNYNQPMVLRIEHDWRERDSRNLFKYRM
jgi:hypothetical protein